MRNEFIHNPQDRSPCPLSLPMTSKLESSSLPNRTKFRPNHHVIKRLKAKLIVDTIDSNHVSPPSNPLLPPFLSYCLKALRYPG